MVFLLNGCPLVRLDWPFTGDNRGVEELATAPREGPQQHLGATLSWGVARTLVNPPMDDQAVLCRMGLRVCGRGRVGTQDRPPPPRT